MSTATQSREDILAEICNMESRIAAKRDLLPSVLKSFYVFFTDKRKIWVYAAGREDANQKLNARMNNDYGVDGWKITSQKVLVYNDPIEACHKSPGNLLFALCRSDAIEFVRDWRDNERGRVLDRPKDSPLSQLERDIKSFEFKLAHAK